MIHNTEVIIVLFFRAVWRLHWREKKKFNNTDGVIVSIRGIVRHKKCWNETPFLALLPLLLQPGSLHLNMSSTIKSSDKAAETKTNNVPDKEVNSTFRLWSI